MMAKPSIEGRSIEERLLRRWLELAQGVGLRGDVSGAGHDLLAYYGERHRRYHGLTHLTACLDLLDEVGNLADDPHLAGLALWFHDAIYEVGATDNEARSAALADGLLKSLGLANAKCATVARTILATDHRTLPQIADARLVCDIDLSILGSRPAEYDRYARDIEAEAGLPPREFRQRRADFLRGMLARPRLFHTEPLRTRFEASAVPIWRANLVCLKPMPADLS
jgi:predicted metal-dependent HD superfamily phosphohydrolase